MKNKDILTQYESSKKSKSITQNNVWHVSLEFGTATLGGLGTVITEMVEAQNKVFDNEQNKFNAQVITPYYKKIYKTYGNLPILTCIKHFYNGAMVKSAIYVATHNDTQHLMITPLFNNTLFSEIENVNDIYTDNPQSPFIERIKYFNSAVAAVAQYTIDNTSNMLTSAYKPSILILHDWHVALTAVLLSEVYKNNIIKTIFLVHVSNVDHGSYPSSKLEGLGLKLTPNNYILKAMGLNYADKIVTVSQAFLRECLSDGGNNLSIEYLRKLFVLHKTNNKIHSIANGCNYEKFNFVKTLNPKASSLHEAKTQYKQRLALMLGQDYPQWYFSPELPVILFIARAVPEKGIYTFAQLIAQIKGKATFFALVRGMTDDLQSIIAQHSTKTTGIFISAKEEDQKKYGALIRASADFTFMPSERESFCLVVIEGFINGALAITTGVGGMEDFITPLDYKDKNNIGGNALLFSSQPKVEQNPSLTTALTKALDLWASLDIEQKNRLYKKIMLGGRAFDWLAPEGSIEQYTRLFEELLIPPQQIASKYKA